MADDDEYNPDALDDDQAQDDDGRIYDITKERIIALIDADRSMLEPLAEGDEEQAFMCWAVEMVSGIMQDRIRTSPRDEFGIIFYSTVTSSAGSDRTFQHVYEFLPLEVPSARSIRKLAAFDADEFQVSPGCADVSSSPGQAAEDLRYGLWACWDSFTRAAGAASSSNLKQQSRVAKTILLFTNNSNPLEGAADPSHIKEQLETRAQELGALAVHIEVLPLIQLQDPSAFDHTTFWSPLLAEARATARTLAAIGAAADSSSDTQQQWDDAEALLDETEDIESKILRVKGLGLRSSGNRKRPLDAMTWSLSPDFKLAVKLYGLVMPAKKPHHVYVTAAANEEVTKTRAHIDADTGAILTSITHRSFEVDARQGADRFPKVTLRNEEIAALKTLRPKGLVLLGFKPVSCLRDYHTLSPSRFVYPDERALRGSTAAFVALHAACLADEDDPQMAVCSYVTRHAAMPSLVALLPQPEETDGEQQVVPPGFHLIPLPFKDDIRKPESDPALLARVTGGRGPPPRANTQQVAAAAAVINSLSIDGVDEDGTPQPFSSSEIFNAALERHFQVLEALALDEEVPPKEELEDDTEPDVLGISRHRTTLDAFKLAVFGSVEGAPEKQKSGGTKRKTDDPEARKAIAEEYAEHDWSALAAPGAKKGLNSLTIPTLKVYLQHHGLRTTGNKGEIVQRIQEHVLKSSGS